MCMQMAKGVTGDGANMIPYVTFLNLKNAFHELIEVYGHVYIYIYIYIYI